MYPSVPGDTRNLYYALYQISFLSFTFCHLYYGDIHNFKYKITIYNLENTYIPRGIRSPSSVKSTNGKHTFTKVKRALWQSKLLRNQYMQCVEASQITMIILKIIRLNKPKL